MRNLFLLVKSPTGPRHELLPLNVIDAELCGVAQASAQCQNSKQMWINFHLKKRLHQILPHNENKCRYRSSSSSSHTRHCPYRQQCQPQQQQQQSQQTSIHSHCECLHGHGEHPDTLSCPQLHFQTLTTVDNMDVTVT
ncbi:hypothetical protein F2P81_023868 [Scophthalmus maximus]|uniref:Uncharacterized protein n=1 Tax=Scophthalmus maximus TaxID=52904 RepID=A0A6A4RT65_SCOMX|nr:hypothetical protein F2P81_023868 [Scophthalmus maximus]